MTNVIADIVIAAMLAGNVSAQSTATEVTYETEPTVVVEQAEQEGGNLQEPLLEESIINETEPIEKNTPVSTQPTEEVQQNKDINKEDNVEIQNQKFDHDIASYTTRYAGKDELNRNYNIRLASDAIHGVILQPGDSFSFNQEVLDKSNGGKNYKEAGVYVNGKVSTGIGGGICQVSSTLYQAALYSGMTITQRKNHSLPVGYMPLGRDATVSWGSVDLQFRNDLKIPVMIESVMKENTLKVRFLSQSDPNIGNIKVVVSSHGGGYLLSRIREDGTVDYTASSYYTR